MSTRVSHPSASTVVALVMIRKNVSVAKEPTASSGSGEVSRASSGGDNNPTQSVPVASGTESSLYGPWMQAMGRRRRLVLRVERLANSVRLLQDPRIL